jgi:hypothetical protein
LWWSRAPLKEIAPFQKRMGWRFKWVSSYGSDFNYDYHVSFTKEEIAKGKVYYNYEVTDFQSEEMSGRSVFYKNEAGNIFHTYSSYARGGDHLLGAYNYLDLTPKGRNESRGMADWMRHHDKYGAGNSGGWTSDTWTSQARKPNAVARRRACERSSRLPRRPCKAAWPRCRAMDAAGRPFGAVAEVPSMPGSLHCDGNRNRNFGC